MRFAEWVVRLRLLVVAGWIASALWAVLALPSPGGGRSGGLEALIPQDSRAIQTEIDSFELFGFPLLSRTIVVQRDPEGLSARAQARVFLRALALNRRFYPDLRRIGGALPITNTLQLFPASSERSTTALTYLFFEPEIGLGRRDELARRFVAEHVAAPGDALVGVTGAVPGRVREGELILASLPRVEFATVILIALIVGAHFRSLGAPLVTLTAAGIAYVITIRVVASLAQRAGIAVPEELEPLIVVLLLGIVTDYSIFFLSGMEARLRAGDAAIEAAGRSAGGIMPIIVVAGLTVAAGTAALVVATLEVFKALGPGLALTVLVGLAVAVTFVPAALALVGRGLFWPRRLMPHGEGPVQGGSPRRAPASWRGRFSNHVVRPPVARAVAAVCVVVLVVLASFVRDTALGFSIVSGLPDSSEPQRAAQAAARGFVPGILSPSVLVLREPGIGRHPQRLAVLQELIENQPGVAATVGPRELSVLARALERLPQAEGMLEGRGNPARLLLRGAISSREEAARLVVILRDPPLGARAIGSLRGLRAAMPSLLSSAGLRGASFGFAGDTALAAETIDQTLDDLRRIAVVVFVASLVLLGVFLRAIVAPVYLMVASFLGFLASLGLTTVVFQRLFDQPSFSFFVPFAAAVLLVSLGSDYNIFLVGGIWKEARERPLRDAVALVSPRAGGAIALAGITLAASFAILALVPLDAFRQFAFAMAAGILIDTFVVRSFLVPAVIAIAGDVGAWPGRVAGAPAMRGRSSR